MTNVWLFKREMLYKHMFRGFSQTYVQGKCSKLKSPNKKLDPNYSGDYDLWLDGIRIEVKASR
ncbi:MAG TPA: hypothetical protein PKY37_03090, partial [Paludibacteraceae bacterium]|nr:hypothetical protein [Paludibacteraceae bacterium]